jgi:hypothetical protein
MSGESISTLAEKFVALLEPPAIPVSDPDVRDLEAAYRRLPARFPALYEHLVLHYRWEAIDLPRIRLLANPGPSELLGSLLYDRHLADSLLPAGLIPFARAAGGSYDPICFNVGVRHRKRDYQVVRVDHEEILCRSRIGPLAVVSSSFRELAVAILEDPTTRARS